ncbi:2-dehydro-3-deoxygluconokinase [Arthrobacter sp. PvP023]|uniref:sugar kinase n=1 Tax=Micrococcaceae TaxID=1268 RepID=UPI001AE1359D|nr:sugar kinase [Arthrobacter sp. PvP023]MBP1136630.1 2-dehydro-3-deoxygluconokinase [Arthrobacter sp. PvP023]
MILDVLCVGETMAVVTPAKAESLSEAEECLLGFGGAESNVAAHLAEFGYRTGWASRVGNDPFGHRIIDGLAARGVDVTLVTRDSTCPTGVYFKDPDLGQGAKTLYYRAGSAASRMAPADSAAWPLEQTGWIHTTGINAALSESCSALTERLLKGAGPAGYKVSFDVNYRPALWNVDVAGPRLLELARLATVVLVGLDEAETLWGCNSAEEVSELLQGPLHVVIKDSASEAVEFVRDHNREERVFRVPANLVEVVEPVGAGDAFAAGYLAGLLRGDNPEDRLAMGHSFAAWTLGTRADFRPGHGTKPRSYEPARNNAGLVGAPTADENPPRRTTESDQNGTHLAHPLV